MKCKSEINYGLYLIADRRVFRGRNFLSGLEEAMLGGVTLVQLREKELNTRDFYHLAVSVKTLTEQCRVPLIINDRLDIAMAVDAEGVHLGREDLPAEAARDLLGDNKVIGLSAANLDEARRAEATGADYIGVGALHPTSTKPNTRSVTAEQLAAIKAGINIPVVAIGGIRQRHVGTILETGVDGIAVASAILGEQDIRDAARTMKGLMG